jgi:hypothetical protein
VRLQSRRQYTLDLQRPAARIRGAPSRSPERRVSWPVRQANHDFGSHRSVVGTWLVSYTFGGAPGGDAFIQWHSDGTECENINHPVLGGNICMGSWKVLDARHALATTSDGCSTADYRRAFSTRPRPTRATRPRHKAGADCLRCLSCVSNCCAARWEPPPGAGSSYCRCKGWSPDIRIWRGDHGPTCSGSWARA